MKYNFSFLLVVLFIIKINAQDPLFTNTQQSLLYLNPSFAGSNSFIRNQFAYRSQWLYSSSPYITLYNGLDMYLKKLKSGFGITYQRDDQGKGTLITDRIDLTYAQHFSLLENKLKIIPSLQVTYFQKHLDKTKLTFGSEIWQTNPGTIEEVIPSETKQNVDFSSGLIINYKHFYFGTSVFHINQPDEGLLGASKLPARLSIFTSGNIQIGKKSILNILARIERQKKFQYGQLSFNILFLNHFIFGCGFKSYDIIYGSIGFRHNYFTLLGSYELDTGPYSHHHNSYELTASFNLRNKEQRKLLTDFERW